LRALRRLGAAPPATALASLLRAAARRPRRGAPMPPGLAGERFLAWLDERAPAADRGAFLGGPGRVLAEAPYAAHPAPVAAPLARLAERWLKANL
jgi:hypothetical protein